MHNPKRMARLHNPDNGLDQPRSLSLTVMPLLHDPVEQLPAGAELHHDVHEHVVLVGAFYAHHVGVLGEVVHDLDLPPDVVVVLAAEELALGDGLAGVLGAGGLVGGEVGGAELALAELLAEVVVVA